MSRRVIVIVSSVAAVVLMAAIALGLSSWGPRGARFGAASSSGGPSGPVQGPADAPVPQVDTAALVKGVPHATVAQGVTAPRLAPGLVPPSNRWYSGLVFGAQPQPVFPLPLSFALAGGGFQLGAPKPVATAKTIAGPHVPAVTVDVGAASSQVIAADPVSVTVALLDGSGARLGHVALAEGSPFASFTADRAVSFGAGAGFAAGDGPAPTVTVGDTTWALVVPGGALHGSSVTLQPGQTATWYPLPHGASAQAATELASAAADPVTGVDVSYGVGDQVARTTLTYRTAKSTPSAYVLMPHQRTGTQPARTGCDLGTYPSIYGDLTLCRGSVLTAYAPLATPSGSLDLSHLTADQKAAIATQVRADVASTGAFASDTYFGGKNLYRAATLVVLGEQVGAKDAVADLRTRTEKAIQEWADPKGCTTRDARCFVYDDSVRSVIGKTPSFGSDQLNDHHFHYGYLLSAAGLLAKGDPGLAATLRPVLDLVGQDIAAAKPSDQLPQLRVFDPYMGHSWASGTSPFADGNNQESGSEAVNAWNGLGLWAAASGQDALGTEATWLMSTEAASVRAYWTAPDLSAFSGFQHKVVAMNWGGKRDYATWFSPEPSAMLGIQLIPMNPASGWLAQGVDPARITAAVDEAAPNGYGVQFGDYLLMYRSMAGGKEAAAAWTAAQQLPDTSIDNGDSKAYLLAFIAAHSR
ncbi:MAG: 1,3-beta-glucanase [Cellulomonas sp. 73-145]|uniref:glycosyl hydrolase n=1 Tax=Cellulomonas sp. 73-145 TaxID=1895739 RepID=UPI000927C2AD|nr:glycosyl hydrolase [Cellulomonas sp. 73-145]OJV56855.1 MAG: 1,3-beta-glucanase [Cellulomonas sp. 73-145]